MLLFSMVLLGMLCCGSQSKVGGAIDAHRHAFFGKCFLLRTKSDGMSLCLPFFFPEQTEKIVSDKKLSIA